MRVDVTEPVSTAAKSARTLEEFASRRTLVLRRFLRSRSAVASLVVLALLFVGCYALPPLLPYSYTDLDFYALQQPPSTDHWFGTNALGQDLLAQILRGMQKSMLIGRVRGGDLDRDRGHRRLDRRVLRRLARPRR